VSRDISVITEIAYGLEYWCQILWRGREFLSSYHMQKDSGVDPAFYPKVTRREKRPEREASLLSPSSAFKMCCLIQGASLQMSEYLLADSLSSSWEVA
jgi:hypothetical protein